MNKLAVILFLTIVFSTTLWSQNANLSQRISVSFEGTTLEEALAHLSMICQIQFAYSADKIPLEETVHLAVEQEPLGEVLDLLFAPTQIIYARIGHQIVLKIDEKKNNANVGVAGHDARLSSRETEYEHPEGIYRAEEMKSDSPVQQETPIAKRPLPTTLPPKALIGMEGYEFEIDYSELDFQGKIDLKNYQIPIIDAIKDIDIDLEEITALGDSVSAHVGVFPKVEKRFGKGSNDNFSANLLWGKSQNIDGVQVSGLLNSVDEDMTGIQFSLLGNIVEGTVEGAQLGGLFNYSAEDNFGTQVALGANIAQTMVGAQITGITNQAQAGFVGLQIAGIHNNAQHASGGTQFSGLYNQASGLINAQIALINKAQTVKGIQFGLLNMADTVSGAPIALLNLVKRGYNRLELSYNESFSFNIGLKLGARGFYNIFQASAQTDFGIWGFGYGFGTYAKTSKRTGLNFELVAMHLTKKENWVNKINALGQFKLAFDVRLGQKASLFVGPILNVHYTEYFDTDSGLFQTTIAPYTLYEQQTIVSSKPNRTQAWVEFSAGLRF